MTMMQTTMNTLPLLLLFALQATASAWIATPAVSTHRSHVALSMSSSSSFNTETTTSSSRVDIEEGLLRSPLQSPLTMATAQERQVAMSVAQAESIRAAAVLAADTSRYRDKNNHLYSPALDATGYGAVVVEQGVARVNHVLSSTTASSLLRYINQQLIDSQEEVANYRATQGMRFGNVLAKKSRYDLLLPFEESDELLQALDELLGPEGTIGSIIDAAIGTDAELYELGALISDPGSDRQEIHPDIEYQEALIPLLTCFVALQDVDESMGPTVFLPKTHCNVAAHDQINDKTRTDAFLASTPSRLSLLQEGDASIFNPSTLHAGGANRSDKRRVLLYITFRNVAFDDPSTDLNPGSIRPELKRRRLALSEMRAVLAERRQEGGGGGQ